MLSALTDTGKTATVLRLLREHGGRFLSDDMTIVDEHGVATCFPKPLTISAHTLRAVQSGDLTPSEWRHLRFQSRLHSKGGRSFALTLARFNVPIMGSTRSPRCSSPRQRSVDRLVRPVRTHHPGEKFVIERGKPRLTLDPAATLERALVNTDDAYGFPPFRYPPPAITIGGQATPSCARAGRSFRASSQVRTRVLA
jgi:hypothetical protein